MWQKFKIFYEKTDRFLDRLFARPVRWGQGVMAGVAKQVDRHNYVRKGTGLTGIAVILFACTLAIWIAAGFFRGLDKPISTVQAAEYTTYAADDCTGYVVRKETVLLSRNELSSPLLAEGQKVSAAQAVAVSYASDSAQEEARQLQELEEKLRQLSYAANTIATTDHAAMDKDIARDLTELLTWVSRREISYAEENSANLKGLILRRFSTEEELAAIRQEATAVEEEIAKLRSRQSGSVSYVRAAASGYFSGTTDGYETVLTPDVITTLPVSAIAEITPEETQSRAVGRLIAGDTWYLLCAVSAENTAGLSVGDSLTVQFSGELRRELQMKIVSLGQEEDGKCALVLSCNTYIRDVTTLRQVKVKIIYTAFDGLRVPKQAVGVDENGNVGVFVLEGVNIVWKNVEILYDNGESYLVKQDKSSTEKLWAGDEILLSAQDVFEGKVVLQDG